MASLKATRIASSVPEEGSEEPEESSKKKRRRNYLSQFGWFRTASDDGFSSLEMESNVSAERWLPTHLVIFVHGILGSTANWKFATKQFVERFPEDAVVHCSECNSFLLTLDGVDVMGDRLANEVLLIIKCRPELKRISFVSHSLGGLIARYAIGKLYGQNPWREPSESNRDSDVNEYEAQRLEEKSEGKIAGLEPVNFITSATPHLGSTGHKQIPILCGCRILEKMVADYSWILRRTGKHLFLKDNDGGKPPLLLQMVDDCEELKFISALQSFKRCVAYANTCYDHIVGWKTSSIRQDHELPKSLLKSKNDKYPHIINEEVSKGDIVQEEVFSGWKMKNTDWKGTMVRGLNKVSWERIDVSFHKSKQRYLAHSNIQVKYYCINSDGADVIFHMIDNFLI